MSSDDNGYETKSSDELVATVFRGGLSMADAIQQLRKRLLDLSSRNRLLNYRHPKGRSLQIADQPDLNFLFERLVDGKSVAIAFVPEPDPSVYEGSRKPDARQFALSANIDTSYEFAPSSQASGSHPKLKAIQTLLYAADLEKFLRRMATEARTVIEETGTNMLYLMFGFLEFFDSDVSDRPMLAPLLALPAALGRGQIDPVSRAYKYTLSHSGEDLAENQSLREKLAQDFRLRLPEFDEDDTPEQYFEKIAKAIKSRPRWKVRRQLTLGFLSFGKLAIWADLDPEKWPDLLTQPLLQRIFSGTDDHGDAAFHAEDYDIDAHPDASPQLIYDADSSQHSAIIDVLAGKDLVINGPPGTGKSQTITNIIASALAAGKKVLFVSEKLAALEVVRNRLERAGLGHFCLELHSHKTQKKKLMEDLQARVDARFGSGVDSTQDLRALLERRKRLNRYAELLNSSVGNALGQTAHEVLWAAERRRQDLGDAAAALERIGIPGAAKWTREDFDSSRGRVDSLAQLYEEIGRTLDAHPWSGFEPRLLGPGDENRIAELLYAARDHARLLVSASKDYAAVTGDERSPPPTLQRLRKFEASFAKLGDPPAELVEAALPLMFSEGDATGVRSKWLLAQLSGDVALARSSLLAAERILLPDSVLTGEAIASVRGRASVLLAQTSLQSTVAQLKSVASDIQNAADQLAQTAKDCGVGRANVEEATLVAFGKCRARLAEFLNSDASLNDVGLAGRALIAASQGLGDALATIQRIASTRGLPFDGRFASVEQLSRPDCLPELIPGARVCAESLQQARLNAAGPLGALSVEALRGMVRELQRIHHGVATALSELTTATEGAGLSLNASFEGLGEFAALLQVAQAAPFDLMSFRRDSFAEPRFAEVAITAEEAYVQERAMRASAELEFHLDAIPDVAEIKRAVLAFRSGGGLFRFFASEWRKAAQLHKSVSRDRRRRSPGERERRMAGLAKWLEHRKSFESRRENEEFLGPLFRGTETDFEKIRRLHTWYRESLLALHRYPGLAGRADLTRMDAGFLQELCSRAGSLQGLIEAVRGGRAAVQAALGCSLGEILGREPETPTELATAVRDAVGLLEARVTYFADLVRSDVPLGRVIEVMVARLELDAAAPAFHRLLGWRTEVAEAAGTAFAQVGEAVVSDWPAFLELVNALGTAAGGLHGLATTFISGESTPARAAALITAKLRLDVAVAQAAISGWDKDCNDWPSRVSTAMATAECARDLCHCLEGTSIGDFRVQEVLTAVAQRDEGLAALARLRTTPAYQATFGPALEGKETNVAALEATHAWGERVVAVRQALPVLARLLLQPGATNTYARAKRALTSAVGSCDKMRESLGGLERWGRFDWDRWQAQVRERSVDDYPSTAHRRIEIAASSLAALLPWSKYFTTKRDCIENGLHALAELLEADDPPGLNLSLAFDFVFFRTVGSAICSGFPELARFAGVHHEQLRAEFGELDRKVVERTGREYAYSINKAKRVPLGSSGVTVGEFTEMALLRRELSKQRRHIPIRQLVRRAGRALQELKPCFMMGPLSVAQYLEPGAVEFDLVVMDEASQLRPEDALGAIARGKQLVVVGDPKQLPPTSFFDRLADDGDDQEPDDTPTVTSGMESILAICQQLFHPPRTLRWHYRSQHESLIAFSNHYFYRGSLIVFPAPYERNHQLGVRYRFVRGGIYRDRRNVPEAQRVVDAVLEHMHEYPSDSLGVVTLNQTQRELIEELLDKKLRDSEQGRDFLERHEAAGWPFFVKNLENVQGDERDVVFISTTYGKVPGTETVRQNFGPISRPDGWRRLNVLFTRAKRRVELFTSLQPEDVREDETTPEGTRALRQYLDYAKHGFLSGTTGDGRDPDSDFEISVATLLRASGYEVRPQLGVTGYFIDMAVRNPDRPGEYLAGIECDGASYHSSASARDRDRIRQEILETLGWRGRIFRIWSTDWFSDPRKASQKLLDFLDARRRLSAHEEPPFHEEVDEEDPGTEGHVAEPLEVAEEPTTAGDDIGADVFAEVGDRVTYAVLGETVERHTVLIVDSASNPKLGLVNENTPLAQALLGLSPGEWGEMRVSQQSARRIQLLKIHREEEPVD